MSGNEQTRERENVPRYEQIPDFIKQCPQIDLPFPGAVGWMISGDKQQVVFIEFDETIEVPEHTHDEQWEFSLAGKVELRRDGRTEVYHAGGNFYIPAGTPHAATVHAGYKALIVFNAPDRYQAK